MNDELDEDGSLAMYEDNSGRGLMYVSFVLAIAYVLWHFAQTTL